MNKQAACEFPGVLVTNPRCGAILGTSPVIIANENLWLRFGVDVFWVGFWGAHRKGADVMQLLDSRDEHGPVVKHPDCGIQNATTPKYGPTPQVEKVFHVLDGYPTLDYPTSSRPILIAAARGHRKTMPLRSSAGIIEACGCWGWGRSTGW